MNAAIDHAADGIRVNAVCPTWVRTPMVDGEFQRNPTMTDLMKSIVPIKRIAETDEVSEVIAFLCSPAASYINGTPIMIDNGVSLMIRRNF